MSSSFKGFSDIPRSELVTGHEDLGTGGPYRHLDDSEGCPAQREPNNKGSGGGERGLSAK
jgi:hypothetical protein